MGIGKRFLCIDTVTNTVTITITVTRNPLRNGARERSSFGDKNDQPSAC
jgi:hypothetical protein